MHGQLTRHTVQVLLAAGHTQEEVAKHAGVCGRSVRRIAKEQPVVHADDSPDIPNLDPNDSEEQENHFLMLMPVQ